MITLEEAGAVAIIGGVTYVAAKNEEATMNTLKTAGRATKRALGAAFKSERGEDAHPQSERRFA